MAGWLLAPQGPRPCELFGTTTQQHGDGNSNVGPKSNHGQGPPLQPQHGVPKLGAIEVQQRGGFRR